MDTDRIEGQMKETGGSLTGDESLEREGEAQSAWGETKDKAEDAFDGVKEKAGDAWDGIKDKLDGDDEQPDRA